MRRIAPLFAALAALMLTGSALAADPVTRFTEHAADDLAASCRNLLGPEYDARCAATPGSRRVVRAEIDAYQASWVHRALRTQYALGSSLTFGSTLFPGTHNSFNRLHGVGTDERPGVSELDANQQLSITDQLRLDMRSLEIDVHWFPNPEGLGRVPVVCHAQPNHGGCSFERPLATVLAKEIGPWLRDHPREVVLLYIEDHLSSPEDAGQAKPAHAAALKVLEEQLGSRIMPTAGTDFRALTRDAVLAAGQQVVLVGSQFGTEWDARFFDWRRNYGAGAYEVEYGPEDFSSCASQPFGSRFVRFFEDSTFLSSAIAPQDPPGELDAALTRRLVACGINLFGFDQLLPDDARLAALAWSWAPGETAGKGCATQRPDDGRWERTSCARKRPAACRTASGGWTTTAGTQERKAETKCADLGATYATPRSFAENAALRRAAGGERVWLSIDPSS